MASNVVGTAYVRLRLLTDSVGKDIEKAVKSSDLQDVNIKVDADTLAADAQLETTAGLADDLERKRSVNVDTKRSTEDLKLLSTAIVALGPALVPIGAAAVAAGASLGALGVTGALAIGGVKREMADGTVTGKAYTATLGTLKGDLDTLERTAARGVLTGFQASVHDLQPLMPTLNADTAALSSKLGDIASHVMPGLVRLFTDANPLLLDFADDLDKGAAKFEAWTTSSDGATKFVAYARTELPKVEDAFVSLATTAGHLAQGLAPLGGTSLAAITAFSKVVNALPIGVLQALAPAIAGFKVASTVSAGVTNLSIALEKFGGTARILSYGDLALATGQIGAMTAAVVGLNTVLEKFGNGSSSGTQAIANFSRTGTTGADGLSKALHSVATVLGLSHDKTKENTDAVNALNTAASSLGGAPTTAVKALLGAQTAAGITIDKTTYSINAQTTAAGLLSSAFLKLNGNALDVEQTEDTFRDTLDQLTAGVKTNGTSLDQNTAKGRANREQIVSLIKAANDAAQATADQTASTKGLNAGLTAGRQSLINHEQAIRNAAAAAGLDKGQVDALIRSLGKVPRNVVSAINVKMSGAEQVATLKANLAALKSKQIDITTYVNNVIRPTLDLSTGGPTGEHSAQHKARGGSIADGWFVVGEQGYELGYKHGSQVQIVPHGKARAMTGMDTMPGYAGGTTAGGRRYLPLLRAIDATVHPFTPGGAGSGRSVELGAMSVQALAAALAERWESRPVELVATNGGLPLAKVVNDANLRNARRGPGPI